MSEYPIKLWFPGKPGKQGSKRIVPHKKKMLADNRVMKIGDEQWIRLIDVNNPKYVLLLDDDRTNKAWRQQVALTTINDAGKPLLNEGVMVVATFLRKRPVTHYTSKGELSAVGRRAVLPATRPDSFKMMRSVEDALQGILWTEDSRITTHIIRKRWTDDVEGVFLLVWPESRAPEIVFNETDH